MRQQKAAYPIHPELIDVLYKKWSTAPDFPRTRATLQLLASIVADQWANRREAYSIQSAHVDLERERIRTRIVSAAGSGGGFDGVVAADIIGGDAHADMQDQDRGSDYARHHIGRGVATTLLMHSFGGRERSGATSHELRLGTVSPNVGPEYVAEVLNTLEERLWYVHREGEALRFQTRPNIYRVIAQTAAEQPVSAVSERLRAEVDAVVGAADGFRVLAWVGEDGQVPDNPEPTIAVLPSRFAVSGAEGNGSPAGDVPVRQLWDRVGGGLRQWRNALILISPDQELWGRAEEAVREVLAYDSVIASTQGKDVNLTQLELRDLRSRGTPSGTAYGPALLRPIGGCTTRKKTDWSQLRWRCRPQLGRKLPGVSYNGYQTRTMGRPKSFPGWGPSTSMPELVHDYGRTKAKLWTYPKRCEGSPSGPSCPFFPTGTTR